MGLCVGKPARHRKIAAAEKGDEVVAVSFDDDFGDEGKIAKSRM